MFYLLCVAVVILLTALGVLVKRQQQLLRSHQIMRQQLQESQIQQTGLTETLQELRQQKQQLIAEANATLQAQVQSQLAQKLEPLELREAKLSEQESQLAAQAQALKARQVLEIENQNLEAAIARAVSENEKAQASLQSLYDQLDLEIDQAVAEKTTALGEENQALRDHNQQLQTNIQQIYQEVSNNETITNDLNQAQTIEILAQELDLYSQEKLGIILDLLGQSLHNYQSPSRRLDIITDILSSTPNNSERNDLKGRIKQLFRGYRKMNNQLQSELKQLGFALHSDNTHYKLHFKGDRRYPIVIPKTSGDHRVGENITSQINNTLL